MRLDDRGYVALDSPARESASERAGQDATARSTCVPEVEQRWQVERRWRSSSLWGVWQSGSYEAVKPGNTPAETFPGRIYPHERQLSASKC